MKNKKIISIALSVFLGGALLYIILKRVGLSNIAFYMSNLNYWWILISLATYTLDMLLRAYKWQYMLKDNGVFIGVADSFKAYNLGNTLNIIVPAKIGDIARSYYLKNKFNHSYSSTLPSVFLDRFFDVLGVYVVLLISGIYVLNKVSMPPWFFNLIFIGVAFLIIAFFVIQYLMKNKFKVSALKNEKIKNLLLQLINALEGSIKDRVKFITLLIYSSLIWICDGLVTYFVLLSLGGAMNPLAAAFATMVATLTKVFPVTPGGIGVFEGTMVIILSLFGLTGELAGMLSALTHIIMNLYTLIIGVYVLVTSGINVSTIQGEKVNK
ncbi:hypothetical protein OXPF_01500 [Oxobacter pfennigii]|uniref:Phosphatidylglycerol lysyltransferase n=1 Tax=Oxobacter pfennigii TaxID=36849 RepID=A0A0P9ALI9_9CLOT|nr:lysylphosphatidylglycerol synthase transmembrane domain-containing protein [Oxobacter pfennigii]KPU46231.1 hypothetical protein OXPF_01500 [Oxobacter pfennigii]